MTIGQNKLWHHLAADWVYNLLAQQTICKFKPLLAHTCSNKRFLGWQPKSLWMRAWMVITDGLIKTFWKYFRYLTFSSGAVTKGSRASCIIRNLSVCLIMLRGLPVTFLIRGTSPAIGRSRAPSNSTDCRYWTLNYALSSWILSPWSLPSIMLTFSMSVSYILAIVKVWP